MSGLRCRFPSSGPVSRSSCLGVKGVELSNLDRLLAGGPLQSSGTGDLNVGVLSHGSPSNTRPGFASPLQIFRPTCLFQHIAKLIPSSPQNKNNPTILPSTTCDGLLGFPSGALPLSPAGLPHPACPGKNSWEGLQARSAPQKWRHTWSLRSGCVC